MIDPRRQWALMVEVTDCCTRACSNCTRFVGHRTPFVMDLDSVERAVDALRTFPYESPPFASETHRVANKVIGIMGGEPLLHPRFAEICSIVQRIIPDRRYRGLWTGTRWQRTRYAEAIEETFGYVNNNLHERAVHSPVLVAIEDVVATPSDRQRAIERCWLQRTWSGSVNPRGFFFCEVAASLSLLFDGPPGLPVDPYCWDRPLSDFQEQIDWACPKCGVALNLKGRLDSEERDDVSSSNLKRLADSERVKAGRYVLYEGLPETEDPWRYMR